MFHIYSKSFVKDNYILIPFYSCFAEAEFVSETEILTTSTASPTLSSQIVISESTTGSSLATEIVTGTETSTTEPFSTESSSLSVTQTTTEQSTTTGEKRIKLKNKGDHHFMLFLCFIETEIMNETETSIIVPSQSSTESTLETEINTSATSITELSSLSTASTTIEQTTISSITEG